jgi:methionyl aminopeptidase
MISTQAVTILGSELLVVILSSAWSPPGGALHRQMRALAQLWAVSSRIAEQRLNAYLDVAAKRLLDPWTTMRNTLDMPRDVMMGLAPSEARDGRIKIHGPEAFGGMRRAGVLAAETLDFITPHVRPGITTEELDRLCHNFIVDHDAIPAPLNYRGFPKSICTSINHVVCHGIPGDRRLMEGDILNIDVTVIVDGWHGDTSRMFFIGERIPVKARRLVDVTYEAMMRGIAVVQPGIRIGAIGDAIQRYAESHRYSVVRDFCGHGVGRVFHDAPSILHYGHPDEGPVVREGMFFTVEPMINAGRWEVKILSDGWTAVTKDRSLSAQFEHTIGVTATGYEIFTISPAGLHRPPYPLSAREETCATGFGPG